MLNNVFETSGLVYEDVHMYERYIYKDSGNDISFFEQSVNKMLLSLGRIVLLVILQPCMYLTTLNYL